MRDLGCNTVYISHPNPGDIRPEGNEPGLSPAVWYALIRRTTQARDADAILGAVMNTLDASEAAGLEVVLGIGYQMQMGREWNAAHQVDLRRDSQGQVLTFWSDEQMASPYSPRFQNDLEAYFQWVNEKVLKGRGNIAALNLADEPMGADYSSHAMATFHARYGRPFERASRFEQGDFLSGVVADYAAWSANRWVALNPSTRTMMTCHVERDAPFFPSIEKIFAATPGSFIVSADSHLDDSQRKVVTERDVNLLYGMVRTLGWLSHVYGKPLMLWTSANGWGLKQGGGLSEAFWNLDIVDRVPREMGGEVAMLMAWGWNIHRQGVYEDTGAFQPKTGPDAFVESLSAALLARAAAPPGQPLSPSRVFHLPASWLYERFAEQRAAHLSQSVVDLGRFDFTSQRSIYLSDGLALDEARRRNAIVVTLQ